MKHWRALANIRLEPNTGSGAAVHGICLTNEGVVSKQFVCLVVPAGLNVQLSEFCLQELAVNVIEPLDQRAFLLRDQLRFPTRAS
jgi:riboflavin synthase alpha subunit